MANHDQESRSQSLRSTAMTQNNGSEKNIQPSNQQNEMSSRDSPVEKKYPPKKKLLPTMAAVYLVFFLVALDRTIIGTAIPTITAEFNSFGDIAWYESAFLLPLCVLQLSFGLVLRYYRTKPILFALTSIFLVGSIVCAAAPTSNALIAGRAITGIGAAGIAPGCYLMVTLIVPLEDRPKFLGSLGSAFGISSILGPILGGYLTSITWRWCFWINLPIGGVSLVLLLLLAPNVPAPDTPAETWKGKFLQLDPVGFLLIAPSISCLLFALQIGGNNQNWTSGRVVALFVVFAVLFIAFAAFQLWRKEKSTLPPSIVGQRTVLVATVISFAIGASLVIYAFYLPVWFQVVQGKSPQSSGLSLLPQLLSTVIAVVSGGILVSVVGYFTPFSIAGGIIVVIGGALMTTWTADISEGKWIGYQIIVGVGLGLTLQQPAISIQTVLKDEEIPIGTSLLNFSVFLGGSVFVTVCQTLFQDQLIHRLAKIAPDLDPGKLTGSAAASLKTLVSPDQEQAALKAYNDSMRVIWYVALAGGALALVASFGLEWKSVKKAKTKDAEGESSEDKGGQENAPVAAASAA